MKTEISRVFRKNALVFWRNPIFRENRFFAKFRDKQDNIDLNIVFAAPLSGGPFRPAGPAMRPAPETVRRVFHTRINPGPGFITFLLQGYHICLYVINGLLNAC